jgi:hypothetical protein
MEEESTNMLSPYIKEYVVMGEKEVIVSTRNIFNLINNTHFNYNLLDNTNYIFLPRLVNKRIKLLEKQIRDTYIIDDKEKKIIWLSDFDICLNNFTYSFKDYTIIIKYQDCEFVNNKKYIIQGNINSVFDKDKNIWVLIGEEYNVKKIPIFLDDELTNLYVREGTSK